MQCTMHILTIGLYVNTMLYNISRLAQMKG